jgi:hypothetical protein
MDVTGVIGFCWAYGVVPGSAPEAPELAEPVAAAALLLVLLLLELEQPTKAAVAIAISATSETLSGGTFGLRDLVMAISLCRSTTLKLGTRSGRSAGRADRRTPGRRAAGH